MSDTLTFDSLSILPASFQLLNEKNEAIDTNLYHLDALNAQLIVNPSLIK
jgi:hypothetical protein